MHSVKLRENVLEAPVLLEWCRKNAMECSWWVDYEKLEPWHNIVISRINFTYEEDALAFKLTFGL